MGNEFSLDKIREFWTKQAKEHGASPAASWSDHPVIHLEIQELLKHLSDGDKVLDIGCANGYSTINLASQRAVDIDGLDYIPEMINQAKQSLANANETLQSRVRFGVGDITGLDEADNHYDKVVVIRVVINLRQWDLQMKGLQECVRVLKPGGTLLLSEATLQGWRKLNAFRAEWGLDAIPIPPFNEYLDEERVIAELAPRMDLVEVVNFASSYFVGTRVFKPLLTGLSKKPVDVISPDLEFNRFCSMMPAVGDYGTQKLLVFKKR